MQAAPVVDQAVAGPQMQMVGIGKGDLRADLLQIGGAPLIAPCVATFIKTGVCTVPWAQVNSPRRAAPSCLSN